MKKKLLIFLIMLFLFSCNTTNRSSANKDLIVDMNTTFEIELEKDISNSGTNLCSMKMTMMNGDLFIPIVDRKNYKSQEISLYRYDLDLKKYLDYEIKLTEVTNQILFDFAKDEKNNLIFFRNIERNDKENIQIDVINNYGVVLKDFEDVSFHEELKSIQPIKLIPTANNDIILLGFYSNTSSIDTVGFIRKFNNNSIEDVSYRKDFDIEGNLDIIISGVTDSDNNLFIAGFSQKYPNNTYDESFIHMYNPDGELIWSTDLNINGINVSPTDIKISKDNKIYVSCMKFNSNDPGGSVETDTLFYILDNKGNIEQTKEVDYSNYEVINDFFISNNGNILFVGEMISNDKFSTFLNILVFDENNNYDNKPFIIEKENSRYLSSICLFENTIFLMHHSILHDRDDYVTLTKLNIR